jgi:hypothetical protein
MQNKVIKLTNIKNETILIGVENIIEVTNVFRTDIRIDVSKIKSIGAMVETNYVTESIEEIYNLINNQTK